MSKQNGSFLARLVRTFARGSIPIDGSQCDGPCIVNGPVDATKGQRDRDGERQSPIRWVSLR